MFRACAISLWLIGTEQLCLTPREATSVFISIKFITVYGHAFQRFVFPMNFSWTLCALTSLLCYLASGLSLFPASRPNIIFIMADDLGWGDVGFNGQEHIQTPELDRLAENGLVFDAFYAGSTVCMPSRCALMTGKHPGHMSVRGNPGWTADGSRIDLQPEDVTVAEELKRAGYYTGIIGKWGLEESGDESGLPNNQGFDYFFGYRDHVSAHHYYPEFVWRNGEKVRFPENDTRAATGTYIHDVLAKEALAFVEDAAARGDQPFFLYLADIIPHYELTVPEESKEPYRDLGWPKKPMKRGHYRNDPDGHLAYAGMVSRMDGNIGKLMRKLEDLGIAGNTLVIFTSDNGPVFSPDGFFESNGPFSGAKRSLREGGIRVPTVAYWPGKVPAGQRTDHLAAFWDVLPTFCQIAGVQPTDPGINGISILPTLLGQPRRQESHEYLYWEFNERAGPTRALRRGDWKILLEPGNSEPALYHLKDDPAENNNLAEEHPEILAELQDLLQEARIADENYPLKKLR